MNKYILRFRAVNKDIFRDIKSGKKTVETRAATERYRDIKDGDVIVLVCGKNRFEKKIKKAKFFRTIKALTKTYSFKKIMPNISSEKELGKRIIANRTIKKK